MIVTFDVLIKTLERKRTVRVYLPLDYETTAKPYPVLFMQDGHNLFSTASSFAGEIWDAHHALDAYQSRFGKNLILVGIDCSKERRLDEYSPWPSRQAAKFIPYLADKTAGGEGDLYVDFIVHQLLPMITSEFRCTEQFYLAGSSMGGFISLYGGFKYPQIFTKVGALSPAFWFEKEKMIDYIKEHFTPDLGIYLDVGTEEGLENLFINNTYLNDTLEVHHLLESLGSKNLKLFIDQGGTHSETDWRRRFPAFIEWLMNDNN
jgi:predicted alpha/beta superfamily hydrolase